ncbi:MAG TPA: peptide-modifying radical SAM enzyme CbpB [Desulfomonilaceae bacterium]|nr:peptide-modifying radical SAM enzyme CbpB [Desulfomonilaceae bacterium]
MGITKAAGTFASSRGRYFNSGNGPTLQFIDIEHSDYVALLDPDTAFWSLLKKEKIAEALEDSSLLMQEFRKKRDGFTQEMELLRFGLKPSAVYFNPTERCNLNCSYCYIPEEMRRNGGQMSREELIQALGILKEYFSETLPEGRLPQVVFHGSEPMLARDAVFAGIEKYRSDFNFGVQTNGTLLDDESIEFLTARGIGIGLSLDGHEHAIADRTRKNWAGEGFFRKVVTTLERLKGYSNYNVICTVTTRNMESLTDIVNFFHEMEVSVGMLNPVRCTRQGARDIKPMDSDLSSSYLKALDRTYELYRETGRKLVIANFANVLVSIVAPLARRLMCDISPCGGGRCFFAVGAKGDLFPCSEFVGVPEFNGGNLFRDNISDVLETDAFKSVSGRKVEEINPCSACAVRHFCGSPCPAEAYEMNGGMNRPGAFCELYEEQVRYAMRLIADGREGAFLWDGWDSGTSTTLEIFSL